MILFDRGIAVRHFSKAELRETTEEMLTVRHESCHAPDIY